MKALKAFAAFHEMSAVIVIGQIGTMFGKASINDGPLSN